MDGQEDWPWWYWGSDYPKEQWPFLRKSVLFSGDQRRTFSSPGELNALLDPQVRRELRAAEDLLETKKAELGEQCWNSNGTSSTWRSLDASNTWMTLGQALQSSEARQALRNCIHAKNAQEPEAVSFLYNLLSFKGCNSRGPDSQFRVRGGTQALPLRLQRRLGAVKLRHEVTGVRSAQDGVMLSIRGRKPLRARAAILTGPPPAILKMEFDPPLKGLDAQWLQRMPMGTSLKLAAVYEQGPWWRHLGLQGDILSLAPGNWSLPAPDEKLPLFVQCMDHSPYSQQIGVIVCFLEGRQNLYFTQLPPAEQQRLFVDFLAHALGPEAQSFEPSFVSHNWADQPFARGAYTGFFPPGVISVPSYWAAFQQMEKLPNVFLAGSDYHLGFGNGYIEGAIRDGQRAAQKVALRLGERVVV
ncbi:unnamed protein product [Durusdinium trenchii]|uniref:monoamine oxidase n=1 Tax=Durusdinium trenchii TaxID=1381693 RepID=A0ABP0QHW5_9DINO